MFDGWLSSFCKAFGAKDPTISPGFKYANQLRLHQVLDKDHEHNQVKLLHDKGLLLPEIGYYTPSQVGGMKSHATDNGMEQGQHWMKNGQMSDVHVLEGTWNEESCHQ